MSWTSGFEREWKRRQGEKNAYSIQQYANRKQVHKCADKVFLAVWNNASREEIDRLLAELKAATEA